MPENQAEHIIRIWFEEVWNLGHTDLIATYLAPTALVHGVDETGAACVGPDGFKPFYDKLRGAIPDIHFAVHDVTGHGRTAASRWSATGTHAGDHLGPKATNTRIVLNGMSFIRLENGQVVEAWNEWDRLALALAIGAVTPNAVIAAS